LKSVTSVGLVVLTACSGPVSATNCDLLSSRQHGSVLRATLTNNTSKTVTHVGVLVGVQEYEFPVRIEAHQTTPMLVGPPCCEEGYTYKVKLLPVRQDMRGPISDSSCWARAVDFADGTYWSVSPL
jgi:hypothetical protein